MSQNKSEIPLKDRAKKAEYAPNIPMGEREKAQDNYDVDYHGSERENAGYGDPTFNVRKANLRRGATHE